MARGTTSPMSGGTNNDSREVSKHTAAIVGAALGVVPVVVGAAAATAKNPHPIHPLSS